MPLLQIMHCMRWIWRRVWMSRAYPVSQVLFALQKRTGQIRWMYRAEEGIDSNAIVIDDGRVCLIDGRPRYGFLSRRDGAPSAADKRPRRLLALDLADGRVLWSHENVAPAQNSLWTDAGVLLRHRTPSAKT